MTPRPRLAVAVAGLSLTLTAAAFSLATTASAAAPAAPAAAAGTVPKLSHIMEVFLENETATSTFEDPTNLPALAALVKQGSYVPNFHGSGHASLDNYIADFSAEQPTTNTEADCAGMAPAGNCIYPATVPTLATTLDAAGKSWKVYSEGEATQAAVEGDASGACLHSPSLNVPDLNQGPGSNGYATRHNPAEWFDSVLTKGGSEAYCQAHAVDLTKLDADDQSAATLPAWSFVEPDTCHDGHDDQSGTNGGCAGDPELATAPSGTAAIDAWLPGFVKQVMTSPGWDANSVMIITFDEAGTADASGCTVCQDTSAGGRIGALFLGAPVKAGYTSTWQGDHYGLLRTIEASYGLPTLKSLAVDATAASTVHDGDPGVTPVTDIWTPASTGSAAVATGTTTAATGAATTGATTGAATTGAATTGTTKTAGTTKVAGKAAARKLVKPTRKTTAASPTQPVRTLAFTGLPGVLLALAVACLLLAAGLGLLVRRREV